MSIEALKQALNALETIERFLDPLAKWQIRKPKDGGAVITIYPQKVAEEGINDLRQAIAETEKQKPVAHVYRIESNGRPAIAWDDANGIDVGTALYTAPRKWVGLTDEEIDTAWRSVDYTVPYNQFRIDVARAIEAKLKEKNQ